MNVTVHAVLTLRNLLNGFPSIDVPAKSVADVRDWLHSHHPTFREATFEANGRLRDSVLLFIDDRQVHQEQTQEVVMQEGSRVVFVPTIIGG